MLEVVESATYKAWFSSLRDIAVRARIDARVRRLSLGNAGQHRVLKGGIAELKIDIAPGLSRVLRTAWSRADHPALRRRQVDPASRHPPSPAYR